MTTKLTGYGNFIKEMADLFVPFTESSYCEKQFHDVLLPDGTIIEHCWAKDGYIIDNMSSPSKFYNPGECSIRLSRHSVNKKSQAPHINSIRLTVLENIEDIISKNSKNVKFIEKLLGVKDIIGPDGNLKDDIKLQYFLLGNAFLDFGKFEEAIQEEADRRIMLLTPIRDEIIRLRDKEKSGEIISPNNSDNEAFLNKILDGMLYANILTDKIIENLMIVIGFIGKVSADDVIINLDDILTLKGVLTNAKLANLKIICDNLLSKNRRDDVVPESIAVLERLEDILTTSNPDDLRIIIESLKITDLDTIIRLKDILVESNPENIKFFMSIFGVLDEKMLFMLKAILKEGNPEILKQKFKDSASGSDFLGDLLEG